VLLFVFTQACIYIAMIYAIFDSVKEKKKTTRRRQKLKKLCKVWKQWKLCKVYIWLDFY